jgi:hypothetical protein
VSANTATQQVVLAIVPSVVFILVSLNVSLFLYRTVVISITPVVILQAFF